MAILCIYAKSDSSKYDLYDIVEVLDDGQHPGNLVKLPKFFVVKIPNKTREELIYLKDTKFSDTLTEGDGTPKKLNKRKHLYNYDSKMSKADVDEIRAHEGGLLIKDVSISDIESK